MTAQPQSHSYARHLNHWFAPLELVDVPGLIAAILMVENATIVPTGD